MAKNNSTRPLTFWSWNDKIEKKQIRKQISEFAEQGLGGFLIHSRAGLEIKYMSDEWFELCEEAVREAQPLGLDVYIYDEDGWPSGFAGGRVPALGDEYRFKKLLFSHNITDVDPNKVIAVYEPDGNGYRRINTGNMRNGCLIAYYVTDSHYVDLLYHDTVNQHIKHTHEIYKQHLGQYFGSVIKGVFTDEPQLQISALHWSYDIPSIFKEKLGWDIIDDLWKLTATSDDHRSFRHDYWKTINSTFTERFSKPLYEWCEANNLIFTGHYAAEDGLCHQILSNGGVMPNYEYMQMPGIDHLGRRLASPVLMKQVTSVAHQLDRKRVLSETFGCAGWDVTFPELTWIWGWQAAFGVNQPCLHLSAYSIKGIRKRDYPAFYSHQEPWWDKMNYLTQWLNGVNQTLTEGVRRPDVLVISPLTGMWCEQQGVTINQSVAAMSNHFRMLVENLINVQVDFDLGDEQLLEKYGNIDSGTLKLGKGSYSIVIIAQTVSLESSTVELLKRFVNTNGKLVFVNSAPKYSEGRLDDNIGELVEKGSFVFNRRDLWRKYFEANDYIRQVEIRNNEGTHLTHDIVVHTRWLEGKFKTFVFNKDEDASTRHLVLTTPGKRKISIQDPITGTHTRTNHFYDGEKTYSHFCINKHQSIFFEIDSCNMMDNVERYSLDTSQKIDGFKVEVMNDNALTLDYGQYSADGVSFSKRMPIIHMQESLYKETLELDKSKDVIIRYVFRNDIPNKSRLYLAVEDEKCENIVINNTKLLEKRMGWFIDNCIGKYEITNLVKSGDNYIDLHYNIPKFDKNTNLDELFETERNRFYYPVEPESIYILGDFDIRVEGDIYKKTDHYRIKNADFSLSLPKQKEIQDLTSQGLWFYRGNITYKAIVNIDSMTDKVMFKICNSKCVLAQLSVNGSEPITFVSIPFETDIRDLLQIGENSIEIVIYGHNRNILGPHHHMNGQNYFVGLSTFKGTKGFEDFVSPAINSDITWTDDYSFIPFNMGEVYVEFFSKIEN